MIRDLLTSLGLLAIVFAIVWLIVAGTYKTTVTVPAPHENFTSCSPVV